MSKKLEELVTALRTAKIEAERADEEHAAAVKLAAEKKAAKDTAVTAVSDAKRAVELMVERETALPSKGVI
jgi:hypothetical protein